MSFSDDRYREHRQNLKDLRCFSWGSEVTVKKPDGTCISEPPTYFDQIPPTQKNFAMLREHLKLAEGY